MAEFGPVLLVLFIFVLFPLINLIGAATGAATAYLVTKQAANVAATATNQGQAISRMLGESNRILSGGFGQFAKLSGQGGYQGSGLNLTIIVTDVASGDSYSFNGITPFPNVPDTKVAVFEYRVNSTFQMQPFINMSGAPFIGSIPLIGRAETLTFQADRVIEHPEGLGAGFSPAGGTNPPPGGDPPPPPGADVDPQDKATPPWDNGDKNTRL